MPVISAVDGNLHVAARVPKPANAARLSTLARLNRAAQAIRDSIVSVARAQLGRRYRFGGETPEHGFDCSGLVKYIVAALNVRLPRTAAQQATIGAAVPRDTSRLLPGDLLLFGRGKRVSHIGIYVGDGNFIHASTTAHRVIVSKLIRPPYPTIKPWKGVRRLVREDSASVVAVSDSLEKP
jgi:cell wall-associated NlpC family hydrolase